MNYSRYRVYCVFSGLVSLWLVSACGGSPATPQEIERQAFDDMRTEVRGIVEDIEREATLVGLVDQLETDYSNLRSLAEARRLKLRALNADYDTTREEFAKFLDEFNGQLERDHKKFRESRRAFIDATTPEELSAIGKSNTKSMARLANSLMSI